MKFTYLLTYFDCVTAKFQLNNVHLMIGLNLQMIRMNYQTCIQNAENTELFMIAEASVFH